MATVKNLRRFEDYPVADRERMSVEVHAQLGPEREWASAGKAFTRPEDLLQRTGEIVRVEPLLAEDHFGVVSPHRQRTPSVTHETTEQSYPYLMFAAHELLRGVARRAFHEVSMKIRDAPRFAFAVTSLLRTEAYHQHIVAQGKLASRGGGKFSSSHCYGVAFDMDHSGGYVLLGDTWVPTNPDVNSEHWEYIRPVARAVLAELFGEIQNAGVANVIDEIPDGRGVFHVALLPGFSERAVKDKLEKI